MSRDPRSMKMGAIAMDNEMGLETHRNSLEAHRPLRQSVPPRSLIFFMLKVSIHQLDTLQTKLVLP